MAGSEASTQGSINQTLSYPRDVEQKVRQFNRERRKGGKAKIGIIGSCATENKSKIKGNKDMGSMKRKGNL